MSVSAGTITPRGVHVVDVIDASIANELAFKNAAVGISESDSLLIVSSVRVIALDFPPETREISRRGAFLLFPFFPRFFPTAQRRCFIYPALRPRYRARARADRIFSEVTPLVIASLV